MERLTSREDVELIKRTNPQLIGSIAKEYIRLAEFEDFMEKYNVERVEDLELRLEDVEHYAYNCNVEQIDEIIKLKQEKQALKERWQKLKEWVNEFHRDVVAVYPKTLLNKMQELEKENKCK